MIDPSVFYTDCKNQLSLILNTQVNQVHARLCHGDIKQEESVLKQVMNGQEFEELVNYIINEANIPREYVIKVLFYERMFYLRNTVKG